MPYSNIARFIVLSVALAACKGAGSSADNPKDLSIAEAIRVSTQEDRPKFARVSGKVSVSTPFSNSDTKHAYVCEESDDSPGLSRQGECVTCKDWDMREKLVLKDGGTATLSGRLDSEQMQTVLADCKIE